MSNANCNHVSNYYNNVFFCTVLNTSEMKVLKLAQDAKIPTKGSSDAAGFDLYSIEDVIINAKSRAIIKTGIAIELPKSTYGRIASRSGLACEYGIEVGAGVIDSDYRGEIKVLLINNGDIAFNVKKELKIAQLICENYCDPKIVEVNALNVTDRNTNGFGSTGDQFELT